MLAQYKEAPNALSARAMFLNYQFPILEQFRDEDFKVGLEVEYSRHLTNFLNIAAPIRVGKADFPVSEMATEELTYAGMDLIFQFKYFKNTGFFSPYLYGGGGALYEGFDDFTFSAPAGVGFNFRLANHVYFNLKGEYRFGFDNLRDNVALGAGLHVILGPGNKQPKVADGDQDGVPDEIDLCPDIQGTLATKGCPDRDKDGIVDAQDECPTIAGLRNFNGCPDSDGDGISDQKDACPNKPGLAENNGCPMLDTDGDGVLDTEDNCPTLAGPSSSFGCPDRDGDGVADNSDACPDLAGSNIANGCPDTDGDGVANKDDGCPEIAGPTYNRGCPEGNEVDEQTKETLEKAQHAVRFEPSSANLLSESYSILDEIVQIMNRFSAYRLKIGGHTDSIGSRAPNKVLSEERAKACYDYLVDQGVDSGRITYEGFGESQPIATNKYKHGREKNRRVEFELFK